MALSENDDLILSDEENNKFLDLELQRQEDKNKQIKYIYNNVLDKLK